MLVFPRPFFAACIAVCAVPSFAHAQDAGGPAPDFVVTPTRTPQAISRAGSAVTVITADEIAKESPRCCGARLASP
jgi:vitamin B12 transporter